ncbi:hypothetical protein PMAA_012320 [Talaromyces marneffei ATCC 18224]|uniref:Uncharacterized protein n=1 Tax=Talaromyces marneffei (strain ATCC 18224 / CBS 334.59 / QM 7333) TaxID=441960 RepID=B6QVF7_TALMQ|nr:hypothetical protein PMAA_012320 [Talaromyces marneffei ATCC 18224]
MLSRCLLDTIYICASQPWLPHNLKAMMANAGLCEVYAAGGSVSSIPYPEWQNGKMQPASPAATKDHALQPVAPTPKYVEL